MEGWKESGAALSPLGNATSPSISRLPTISIVWRMRLAAMAESLGWAGEDRNRLVGDSMSGLCASLRAGASFHIVSAPIALDGARVASGIRFLNSANGEVTAWVEETRDFAAARDYPRGIRDGIGRNLLAVAWSRRSSDGPSRRTTKGSFRRRAIAVKPVDLDADGNFALAAFVHRFTAGCMQALAAIGATASYLETGRRGCSDIRARTAGNRVAAGWEPGRGRKRDQASRQFFGPLHASNVGPRRWEPNLLGSASSGSSSISTRDGRRPCRKRSGRQRRGSWCHCHTPLLRRRRNAILSDVLWIIQIERRAVRVFLVAGLRGRSGLASVD